MLSKNQTKLIRSLNQKKYRYQLSLFVVEGIKSIREFLNSYYELHMLYTTDISLFEVSSSRRTLITENELKKISFLTTPNKALAVFKMCTTQIPANQGLVVALDGVRDPGNMGTIIRLCDWFGIGHLICSPHTVDCYNPKVVQASMGSLARVQVHYQDLTEFIRQQPSDLVYGTFMDGINVYTTALADQGLLILGNEANGISSEVETLIHKRLAIPAFGTQQQTESLNVATAAAIFLSEFKRRAIEK